MSSLKLWLIVATVERLKRMYQVALVPDQLAVK
jgi:hypothetical protein